MLPDISREDTAPMTAALVPAAAGLPAVPDLSETLERAAGYARAARADNTRRAYGTAWADFAGWCRVDFPPWSGGVRSERHAAARMAIPSMLARASAGVR